MQERGAGVRSACNVGDADASDRRKRRLLIVEDESLIALYLSELLDELGYDVCDRAASGQAALRVAERDRPDLAIVDIGLAGGMDGISTASLLRERFDIPSIFLSGASSAVLLTRARSVQSPGFIHKPFMPDDIERAVNAAFESGAAAGFDGGIQSDRIGDPSDRER